MNTGTIKNKIVAVPLSERLIGYSKSPESWRKAAGIIKNKKQRRALERHVKKMRAEW